MVCATMLMCLLCHCSKAYKIKIPYYILVFYLIAKVTSVLGTCNKLLYLVSSVLGFCIKFWYLIA
jgi:hypothetical protein